MLPMSTLETVRLHSLHLLNWAKSIRTGGNSFPPSEQAVHLDALRMILGDALQKVSDDLDAVLLEIKERGEKIPEFLSSTDA
jgi:hypothetical protein